MKPDIADALLGPLGTVEDLVLLAEVVDCGGFTAASQRCGLSKSRLSRRVAQLEERLGLALIRRDARRFQVSEVGERLAQQGREIRASAESAIRFSIDSRSEPGGTLDIACPVLIAELLVSRVAVRFAAQYPRVKITLNTTDGETEVLAERHDIVLHPCGKPLPNLNTVARRLFTFEYVLVATPALAARIGAPRVPDELSGQDFIGWRFAGASDRLTLQGPGDEVAEIVMHERLRTDSLSVVHETVLSGLGVAALSRWQCADDVRAGRLVVITPGWAPPPIVLYAVYPSRRALSRSGERFLDELTQAFAAVGEALRDSLATASRAHFSEMRNSLTSGA